MEALDRMNETVLRQTADIIAAFDAPGLQDQDQKTGTPSTPDVPYPLPTNDCLNPEDFNHDSMNDIIEICEGITYHKLSANQTPTCDTYALHKLKLQADSYILAIQEYEANQQTRRHSDDAAEASRQKFIRKGLSQARKDLQDIQNNIDLQTECGNLIAALHDAESFILEQTQRERQSEDITNELRVRNLDLETQNEGLREAISALRSDKQQCLDDIGRIKSVIPGPSEFSEEELHDGTSRLESESISARVETQFEVPPKKADADRKPKQVSEHTVSEASEGRTCGGLECGGREESQKGA